MCMYKLLCMSSWHNSVIMLKVVNCLLPCFLGNIPCGADSSKGDDREES